MTNDNHRSETPSQRLVLIQVTTSIDIQSRKRTTVVREKKRREILMFLPEYIVRQIPKYDALLDESDAMVHDDGDADFDDDDTHDHRAFVQTIDFVGGAPLRSLVGSQEEVKKNSQRSSRHVLRRRVVGDSDTAGCRPRSHRELFGLAGGHLSGICKVFLQSRRARR